MPPREPNASVPTRRRWLRFSLRTFLLVVTALCIWLGVKVNQARRQKRAVAALKALGTGFYYAHQKDEAYPHRINPGHELVVPKCLDELAGYDFFRTVISVQVSAPVSDEDLSHLAGLPYIERLYVTGFGNNVSDWEFEPHKRQRRGAAPLAWFAGAAERNAGQHARHARRSCRTASSNARARGGK